MFINILKTILTVSIGFVIVLVVFLIYIITTDYNPHKVEDLVVTGKALNELKVDVDTKITTFNIGYAGLDKGRDFFMDGGKYSRSESLEKTKENLNFIKDFLMSNESDIYALQEVDERSSRSYDLNQVKEISTMFEELNYNSTFAYNYRTKWVPLPVLDPMGYANSGILTLSKFKIDQSRRLSLPGDEPIPKRYFDLKRCVTESIISVENGKRLRFINLHLSAFDEGGKIRAEQMEFLIDYLKQINLNNEYIVLAGDWNHLLSKEFLDSYKGKLPGWVALLPKELSKLDYTLAYDNKVNTIRSTSTPYVKGQSFETIIDGFLVSNNIEIVHVEGHNLGFEHTDHHPVTLTIRLKK